MYSFFFLYLYHIILRLSIALLTFCGNRKARRSSRLLSGRSCMFNLIWFFGLIWLFGEDELYAHKMFNFFNNGSKTTKNNRFRCFRTIVPKWRKIIDFAVLDSKQAPSPHLAWLHKWRIWWNGLNKKRKTKMLKNGKLLFWTPEYKFQKKLNILLA